MRYKSIETQLIPPGIVNSVEEFKNWVLEDLFNIMKKKVEYEKQKGEEVPLPIGVIILFNDYSMQQALLFPNSNAEKDVMLMAIKKRISEKDFDGITAEPLYGVFTSEIFMSTHKLTEDEQKMDEDELEAKYKSSDEHDLEKVTRILVHFEKYDKSENDVRLYSIIDPGILVFEDKESEITTKAMSDPSIKKAGTMSSLFNWTVEHQMDVLGTKANIGIESFSVETAIKFVQDIINENKRIQNIGDTEE